MSPTAPSDSTLSASRDHTPGLKCQVMSQKGARGEVLYDPFSDRSVAASDAALVDEAVSYYFLAPRDGSAPAFNWELTYACSWSCEHCYQSGRHPVRTGVRLGADEITRAIRGLELAGATEVSLTGGEVMMVENLPEVVAALRSALPGISIRALVAGDGLERPDVDGVLSAFASARVHLRFPVYGATDEINDRVTGVPGSLARIERFCDAAAGFGIAMTGSVGVFAETFEDVWATLMHAAELSRGRVTLSTLLYPGRDGRTRGRRVRSDQMAVLLRREQTASVAAEYLSLEDPCRAGCWYPTIDPSGTLHGCDLMDEPLGECPEAVRGLSKTPTPARRAVACRECDLAGVCRRCAAMAGREGCPPDQRALVRLCAVVAGRRAEAARRVGFAPVDPVRWERLAPYMSGGGGGS